MRGVAQPAGARPVPGHDVAGARRLARLDGIAFVVDAAGSLRVGRPLVLTIVAPWQPWNVAAFRMIHATADSPQWLVEAGIWLAKAPLYVALVLTAWQLLRRRDGQAALRVLAAFAIAEGIEVLVSAVAFQPRPFVSGFGPAWIAHAADNSMPSTHVTLTLIMAVTLAERRWFTWAVALLVLAGAQAWARIYVGVHWPADMLGAVVSAGIACAVALAAVALGERVWRRFRPRPAGIAEPCVKGRVHARTSADAIVRRDGK